MSEQEPYIIETECPHCHGRAIIPGSRNWVAQGWTEAACFHCGTSGRIRAKVVLNDQGIEQLIEEVPSFSS